MEKTIGAHSIRPRVSQGPTPPTVGPSAASPSAVVSPSVPAVRPSPAVASPAPAASDAKGSSSMTLAQRRYHTRVRSTPLAPSHPRPARRAPPAKRTWTLGPEESSTSRSREPPSQQYQGITGALNLSPASIIRQPYFPCDPIPGNVSCRGRDFYGEVYYDLPTFAADPGLRDSMFLVQ